METFMRLVEALAWPATVVALAWLLRSDVSKVLARLSSLKYKDVEANFERDLRQAEAEADHIRTNSGKGQARELPQTIYEQLLRIGELSPRAAIAEAWRYVEAAAVEAARTAQLEVPRALPVNSLVRELIRERIFSDDAATLFDRLRRLRNEAVHGPDFALDQGEVERYIDLALRLEQELYHAGNALGVARGTVNLVSEDR